MESNMLYDLVTTLENKMKAVSAYQSYKNDLKASGNKAAQEALEQICRDDERHVQQLTPLVAQAIQQESREPAVR